MQTTVPGLSAVGWTGGWGAPAGEAALRLKVDPARLLGLLRDLPVARALLSDLQRAVSSESSVELIVSSDRQVAEVAIGTSRYVLTASARDLVLAVLLGGPSGATSQAAARGTSVQLDAAHPEATARSSTSSTSSGVLWESPGAAPREALPPQVIALPWLGGNAHLEVWRDGASARPQADSESSVHHATLRLQLPQLGRFVADIRACGNTVAVSIECSSAERMQAQLMPLQQQLCAQGLSVAHVGLSTARSQS